MSMSKLVGTRGREVLRGPLQYRKKGSGSWKRRAVIVYCGSVNDGRQHSACLALYDNYENVERAGEKKPKKILQLLGAKVEEPTYASPVGSHGTSPSSNGTPLEKACQFLVVLTNEIHEFLCESGDMKVHWLKLLTLLTMFPHSVIPEEPSTNPISEVFRCKLDAKAYRADSAWAVYIMPEEVGSRCHMIGIHILLLKGGDGQSVGRLEIVSPTDTGNLVVAWDRDKMRRTGKTGNLVFVEIGRRCQGGPGLVWMYAGFEEAHPLRETLHRFLFQGDGKAVSIPAYESGVYSRPRSSVDNSLPSSYQKGQSLSLGYQYQHVSSGQLKEVDSGFKDSLISHSASPAQSDIPPPIRLDKHPSFRKQHSTPCRVPRSAASSRCSMSPSESCSGAFPHSVGSFNDDEMFDERTTSRQSVSPPDEGYSEAEESGSGQFQMDPDPSSSLRGQQRSMETYTYVTMVNPNVTSGPQEEYIKMVSAPAGNGTTVQRPAVPSHYDVPPPFRKRSLGGGDSVSSSASPSNYENSGPLPTIEEAPKRREQPELYENFSAVKIKDEEFVHYRPSYENAEIIKEQQRNSEAYQNITLIDDKQQRRGSYRNRCRSMEKEECKIPSRSESSTPPSNNELHLHYAQQHTRLPADTSPPIPPRVSVV